MTSRVRGYHRVDNKRKKNIVFPSFLSPFVHVQSEEDICICCD